MFINQLKDIPKEQFWMIMTIQGTFIPGDERSRTAPGHGYPERTEYHPSIEIFTHEDEWKSKITDHAIGKYGNRNFVALVCNPAEVVKEVKVSVT